MVSTHSRRDILRGAQGFALASPFLGLVGCDDGDPWRPTARIAGATMGTYYSVALAPQSRAFKVRALRAGIEQRLETVNRQMSNWRVESEISRFNTGDAFAWTEVSADTLAVVEEALRVSRLSGGAFDPTVGPLVGLWGFGPASAGRRVPPQARIRETVGRIGFRHVRTRRGLTAIGKDRADVQIDLSGIAKGFAVDRLAEYLEQQGAAHYLVEIGGELRARGLGPRGRVWRVGIERPLVGRRAIQRIVALDGVAIATSGNYRIFFEDGPTRYSHIIDPRSGAPVFHRLASVTVVSPTTMQADALSTALMVLGPEDGYTLASREEIAAWFIVKKGQGFTETGTPAFERYLVG